MSTSTVAQLKRLLQDKTGISADIQELKLRSLALNDVQTLSECDVLDQTMLELKTTENNATTITLPMKHFTKYGNTNSNAKTLRQ
jgi:Ubiquitin family